MSPIFSGLHPDDDFLPVPRTFREASEAKHTPSREELLSMDFEDDDESVDVPLAMTDNDSFEVIEIHKEKEAALREAA